ncbi:MAG: TonB-dependent receptor [Bacteroidia bacterium]|nr:TonB-dependent receptor [Bacteroidia bacterium]NNJ56032.1 TonB-dependent receptor [Bacteroidia bacterium]
MRLLLISLFLVLSSIAVLAQQYTISGRVEDASNGETLIGATILVKGGGGAITNEYGFYSLSLEEGSYTLTYQYLGYEDVIKTVNLSKSKTINVDLAPASTEMETAIITAKSSERKVENKKISVVKMEASKIKEIPVIFGEVDILKTITLLPGIQSAGEGNSGFNVRGGSQDQNLILLDEATVYNASHLLGFFSVFNGDAVKDLEVYKGGIPAKYGGRLSSIVDIKMRDGNNKRFAGIGGIGTISSRLTLEGPIVKDKSSFMVAGRRSYADIFLPLAPDETIQESKLYFYDLNLKANYELSDKDRLYVSGYFGRDVLGLSELFSLNWGNATATLRWNHIVNDKLFVNTSLVYSDFNYGFDVKFAENANFGLDQAINDVYIKSDWTYFKNQNSKLNFGAQAIYHRFNPGLFAANNEESEAVFSEIQLEKKKAFETGWYVDHEYKFNKRLNVRYGLRLSSFSNIGGSEYTYSKNPETYEPIQELTTKDSFASGEIYNTYAGLEPRAAISYNLTTSMAVKGSYNRTFQYIQQATNTASAFPTDQWFSANLNIKPQRADQVAVGLFKNFDIGLETSAEIYYKWMENQIDYRDNASIAFNENLDGELLVGKGWAYGAEFYVAKSEGKTSGFVSYTWAKTMREIEGISGGNPYVANFDRRHNLSVVLTQKFSKRVLATASFVYSSGQPLTTPVGKFFYNGKWTPLYGDVRNNYRIPAYHRADIGVTIKSKEKPDKRFKSNWNFSVYNLYNRENPYAIYFDVVEEADLDKNPGAVVGETAAFQTTLFKIIPAITWNFEF